MKHCDPEALTISSLGERALDGRDAEHLLVCTECAQELARLRRTVSLARGPESDADADLPVVILPPPDRVWTAVTTELGLSNAPRRSPVPSWPAEPVTPTGSRRWWLPAAAAAALIAAAAVAVGSTLNKDEGPAGSVLALADLRPLDSESARGTARWLDTPDGAVVHVELTDGSTGRGYLEVWLLDPDDGRLVSLGTLTVGADGADLAVPDGIAPGDYPYVDVSAEALDGDPSHSGVSVARGDLRPAD